jgi:hypothetical protein
VQVDAVDVWKDMTLGFSIVEFSNHSARKLEDCSPGLLSGATRRGKQSSLQARHSAQRRPLFDEASQQTKDAATAFRDRGIRSPASFHDIPSAHAVAA